MDNNGSFPLSWQLPTPLSLYVCTSDESQDGFSAASSDSKTQIMIPAIKKEMGGSFQITRLVLNFNGYVEIHGFQHWIEFTLADETNGKNILEKKWVGDWESGSARTINETLDSDLDSRNTYSITLVASSRGGDNPATTRMELIVTPELIAKPAPPTSLTVG